MAKKEKKAKITKTTEEAKQEIRDVVQIQQIDGKLYNKRGAKSLDELLGEQVFKYSTRDPKDYEGQLNRMNTSDLQAHAAKVGVLPKDDRRLLIKILMKQFMSNLSSLNAASAPQVSGKKISEETLRILAEGR
jgi:hypothetical protein